MSLPPGSADRILDALTEGLVVVDAGWRVREANAAALRSFDRPREALLGAELWALLPGLAASAVGPMARDVMAARTPRAARSVPLVRLPGDGKTGIFDVRAIPFDDDALLLAFREVTRREQERRALAAQSVENLRLREMARALAAEPDPSRLLDLLCRSAAGLCHAQGATVAEVQGDPSGVGGTARFVASFGHPAGVLGHQFPLAGTLTGRVHAGHAADPSCPLVLRAGADDAEDAAFCPLFSDGRRVGPIILAPLAAHGALLGVLAVSRVAGAPPFDEADEARLLLAADHAALAVWNARLREAAEAASRTQNSFLATVSHELRTPLTALTGYGELLADGFLGELTAPQGEVVERMRAVTHQLTAMIEEILTYSSLEAGRELVRPTTVAVPDVLRAVDAVIEPLAAGKGLAWRLAAADALPVLTSDPDKLRQILVNLAGNAVKFTAAGTVALDVAAAQEGDREVLRFAVTDTGVGIATGDLPRLFRPFSQLDDTLTRRHGGTGLGLYIAGRLARLLGGRIEVQSTPKVGSVFTLVVPVSG